MEAVEQFRGVDVVVLVYGAFTNDDVSSIIAEELNVPVILWAPFEPPFAKDERLYANALVAATMNAASLHALGKTCHVVYGSHDDKRAAARILSLLRAYSVKKALKGTLLGLLGYRPTSYYVSSFDEKLIRNTFGIRMDECDLKVVFDKMRELPEAQIKQDMAYLEKTFSIKNLPEGYLENHSRLYFAMKEVIHTLGYDHAVLKCWPEMGSLKTTPCAVIGRIIDEGTIVGCEGDVDAAITAIIENVISGQPVFITDMINIDEGKNTLSFWHCGNAAPSLHNASLHEGEVTLSNHPLAGQGTAFYAGLKTGKVTIARFANINGAYKLFVLKGLAENTERYTKGSMVNVKVEKPVYDLIMRTIDLGVPHHYSLVWEDIYDELIMYAHLAEIEVLEI
jgi:L-fucose isomerase-like protein